jgi:hypothetical protein
MAVLFGSDGGIQFDLGDGLLCTANVFSWSARLSHETLRTTRQGDEAETRTAGLADHAATQSRWQSREMVAQGQTMSPSRRGKISRFALSAP